jgi:uncharacterized membrane protein YdbT with pleckstrin-like domain
MHPISNSIEHVDPDEKKLAEIFKHPIGIILLYIQTIIGLTVAVGLAYFLLPVVVADTDDAFFYGSLFAFVSVVIAFLVMVIATFIFRQNRMILTDRNITQILQFGLFNRKVSQLNMNNVEDVTAVQNGVLPTLFNYGTLKIETAGEQVNFHFSYCPNAGYYAKVILDARERILGQMDVHTETKRSVASAGDSKTQTPSSEGISSGDISLKELGAETVRQASQNRNS